jgi:hypothetical protein
MRFPRASAVVVALSTFVAVATVAALASQLVLFDRAGAILPNVAITTEGQPADQDPVDEATPDGDDAAPEDSGSTAPGSGQGSTGDPATVVDPAPPETVQPEPEPEPEPEPTGPPESPGNSGNAPGQSDPPGNNGNSSGPGKP